MKALRSLDLYQCPVTKIADYRAQCFSALPSLKYLDGTDFEWEDEWDTTGVEHPNKLPRAVRIILVLEGPSASDPEETEEFTYATTVMLEFSGAVKRSALASGQSSGAAGGSALSQGRAGISPSGLGAQGLVGGTR